MSSVVANDGRWISNY